MASTILTRSLFSHRLIHSSFSLSHKPRLFTSLFNVSMVFFFLVKFLSGFVLNVQNFCGVFVFGWICDCICIILVLMLDLIGFTIWVFCFDDHLYIKFKTFVLMILRGGVLNLSGLFLQIMWFYGKIRGFCSDIVLIVGSVSGLNC